MILLNGYRKDHVKKIQVYKTKLLIWKEIKIFMDKQLKSNVLNEYKYGKINFFEASKKLKKAGMTEKNLKSILNSINRENIFFISDFFKTKHLKSENKIENDFLFEINYDDDEEHNEDEIFFDIEYEE